MRLSPDMTAYIEDKCQIAKAAELHGDFEAAWRALVRAHIVSQPALMPHLRVHVLMLKLGWLQRDVREIVGQLLRLILAPIGHFAGRIPWGNPGRATVSKFAKAPFPREIANLYEDAGIRTN